VAVAELSRQFENRVGQLINGVKSVLDSLFSLLLYVETVLRRVAPSSATATVVLLNKLGTGYLKGTL
jgi:hypothetical protein